MEKIKLDLDKYKTATSIDKSEWQALGRELTEHFKKPCYWILWKYEIWKVRQAFKTAQQEDRPFQYFLGILKNIK